MRHWPHTLAACLACGLAASCRTAPPTAAPPAPRAAAPSPRDDSRPEWVQHPKGADSLYAYAVGEASGKPTAEEARDAAFRNAVERLRAQMLADAGEAGDGVRRAAGSLALSDVEVMPDCVWRGADSGGHACAVQVKWPAEERQKTMEQIRLGRTLDAAWADANGAYRRGEFPAAIDGCSRVLKDYSHALACSFPVESVQVLKGMAHESLNQFSEALAEYDSAAAATAPASREIAADAQKKRDILRARWTPPRFWPMRERWRGEKVALLCAIRDEQGVRAFPLLACALRRDCDAARLECTDIGAPADAGAAAAVLDHGEYDAARRSALAVGAGILLAVLFDIDPARRGATEDVAGVAMPVLDSTVKFVVLPTGAAAPLYSGSFKESAGRAPESRLADRAEAILVQKYLAPGCPGLK